MPQQGNTARQPRTVFGQDSSQLPDNLSFEEFTRLHTSGNGGISLTNGDDETDLDDEPSVSPQSFSSDPATGFNSTWQPPQNNGFQPPPPRQDLFNDQFQSDLNDQFQSDFGFKLLPRHLEAIDSFDPVSGDHRDGFKINFRDNRGEIHSAPIRITANGIQDNNDQSIAAAIMVADAAAKGWSKIALNGDDEDFKQKVWIEATLQGLEINPRKSNGFSPTQESIAELANRASLLGIHDAINGNNVLELDKVFGASPYNDRTSQRWSPQSSVPSEPSINREPPRTTYRPPAPTI